MPVLAEYLFGTTNTGESGAGYSPDTTAAGLTNSVIGNGGANIAISIATTGTYVGNPVCLALTAGVASTTVAQAVTNNCYVEWTVTPDAGKRASLTNLTFNIARGGAATPRGWALRSSRDGYAADIATADIPTVRSTWTAVDIDLTGASFQNLTTATTFRLYLYTPSLSQSIEFDAITLNGTVADTAASGTGAATLGAVTGSGAGTVAVAGSGAATLGAITGAGAGSVAIAGSGSGTLGAITGAGSGAVAISGSGAPSLGAITGAGSGTLAFAGIAGIGAATLGAISGSGSGTVTGGTPIAATPISVTARRGSYAVTARRTDTSLTVRPA